MDVTPASRRPVAALAQLSYLPRLRQRAGELLAAGSTAAQIADALNAEGLRPPKRSAVFTVNSVRELLSALGVRAEAGRVSGGGARSRLWLRIVASALRLPLELTVVEEGSAYGAALLAGVAGGAFADVHQAVEACVRVGDVVEPDQAWQEAYVDGYQRFRELYPALRSHFQRNAVVSQSR